MLICNTVRIHYTNSVGVNDKWDSNAGRMCDLLDLDETFDFFNPKAGLFWQIADQHSMYVFLCCCQKEACRNKYIRMAFYGNCRGAFVGL